MTLNQLQIADRLHLNRVYVARLIKQGRIQAVKSGRSYKVKSENLDKFLKTKFNQKFYTILDVANLLKIHRTTVSKLIAKNELKAVQIGRFFLIPEIELKKLIKTDIPEKVYTIAELSQITNTARTTLVRSIRCNKLQAIKIDEEYRISKVSAEEFFHIPLI